MEIKYIVTGTGRCGTMFMSRYLSSASIPCGHEVIFTNNGLEMARKNITTFDDLQADSSYMAAPYLNSDLLHKSRVIHLVRDPIKVITSFVVGFCYFLSYTFEKKKLTNNLLEFTYQYPPGADPEYKFMKFIYHHVPELKNNNITPLERAAIYYIKWNELIEKSCIGRDFLFHPIESDSAKIANFLGVENKNLYNKNDINKVNYGRNCTLKDIISPPIKRKIIQYWQEIWIF